MKFPFGNKIPFITAVEHKGKKVPDVIIGIPGDQEWSFYKEHPEQGYIYLIGNKRGARPMLIVIAKSLLTSAQIEELELNP
jgi:hypothetical protein